MLEYSQLEYPINSHFAGHSFTLTDVSMFFSVISASFWKRSCFFPHYSPQRQQVQKRKTEKVIEPIPDEPHRKEVLEWTGDFYEKTETSVTQIPSSSDSFFHCT